MAEQEQPALIVMDICLPKMDGLAERFMRTLKEEHVDYADWHSFDEVHPHPTLARS